jgi:hypothetical protein
MFKELGSRGNADPTIEAHFAEQWERLMFVLAPLAR